MEGMEKIIKMVGSDKEQQPATPMFARKKGKRLTYEINNNYNFSKKNEKPKMVEMKIFEDKSD